METGFIRELLLRREDEGGDTEYPYNLPALRTLTMVPLHPRVTFFTGENGTGKSTLLEALAVCCGFNPEGGSKNHRFATRESHSGLYRRMSVVRGAKRERDGYFLRAESFYNLATNLEALDAIPAASRPVTEAYGGRSLHHMSHGESFFALLENRLGGDGLYLFDEPEAALSPMRQLAMLTHLHRLAECGSQMVIATHSPILLSYPGAWIYVFSETGIEKTPYEETEPYRVTRDYLNHYRRTIDELFR